MRFSTLFLATPALLLALCAPLHAGPEADAATPLKSNAPADIPIGIEAVTGYRSESIYRGFKLGQHVIDFQLESEIALTDALILSAGGWYATEASGGDFSEAAGFLDLRYEWTRWALGVTATYHSFTHSFFQDGLDTGLFATWAPNDDFQLTAGAYYDDGPGGWYGKLEGNWSHPTGDKSFVALLGGLSWVDDYYLRSGMNDAYARLSWTYNFNDRVSVTPFLGTSISLDSGPASGSDYLWGGLWFEVNF